MSHSICEPLSHCPSVLLVGDVDHSDCCDVVALLHQTARLTIAGNARDAMAAIAQSTPPPELILVVLSRPGALRETDFRLLQRSAPLAGTLALNGSWCEGQSRTGRPAKGLAGMCWYAFPWWWERQLAFYRTGRCPDWARAGGATRSEERGASCHRRVAIESSESATCGLIAISTSDWEVYAALADELTQLGYSTAWQQPGQRSLSLRGVMAGIWEGGQLDDRETDELAAFCRQLARDAAPIVALLDFPRYDRCRRALEAGAASVLGKPWLDADVIDALEQAVNRGNNPQEATMTARAA